MNFIFYLQLCYHGGNGREEFEQGGNIQGEENRGKYPGGNGKGEMSWECPAP